MSTTVRLPVSCENHDVTAILGGEFEDGSRPVIGLYCVECDATYVAEEACPDCHGIDEHAFNCQLNWL